MKNTLPLTIILLFIFTACKKHEPAPSPLATQPIDSLKSTVPPLNPSKSFVAHLEGTYKGKAHTKNYTKPLPDTNFVVPVENVSDVEIRVTQVDNRHFRAEIWYPGTVAATKSYTVAHEFGDVYKLSPGAPIKHELKFFASQDSLYYIYVYGSGSNKPPRFVHIDSTVIIATR